MAIPNGFYQWDPSRGTFGMTNYWDSAVFAWDNTIVQTNPAFQTIGMENGANWLDPTYGGDNALRNRELMMDIGAQFDGWAYQQSAGNTFFDIYGCRW